MKKQALIITSLATMILLSETDLSSDLLLFFLVGAVPGTDYSLSSNTMLTLVILATLLLLYRQPIIRAIAAGGMAYCSETHRPRLDGGRYIGRAVDGLSGDRRNARVRAADRTASAGAKYRFVVADQQCRRTGEYGSSL